MSPADLAATGALPPAFILTCAKSPPARLDSAHRQIVALHPQIDPRIVMGAVAEDPEIDRLFDAARNRRRAKRPLTRTEIAIYATHRRAWRRLLDEDLPFGLVLEDDFRVRDPARARRAVQGCAAVLGDGRDVVKLFDFERRRPLRAARTARINDVPLVKWRTPTAGMVAYLISRAGARKLMSRDRVFRQVDEDIKYFWELDLDIWSVPGCPIADHSAALGGSLVELERKANRRHGVARSLLGNILTIDRKLRTTWHLALEKRPR
jgi:GR25 family glycosyltransferase involved in LPS biosynthesis